MNWEQMSDLPIFKESWVAQKKGFQKQSKAELINYIEVLTKTLKESWLEYERSTHAYEDERRYRKELQKRLIGL
jgi:hypothetical protein